MAVLLGHRQVSWYLEWRLLGELLYFIIHGTLHQIRIITAKERYVVEHHRDLFHSWVLGNIQVFLLLRFDYGRAFIWHHLVESFLALLDVLLLQDVLQVEVLLELLVVFVRLLVL